MWTSWKDRRLLSGVYDSCSVGSRVTLTYGQREDIWLPKFYIFSLLDAVWIIGLIQRFQSSVHFCRLIASQDFFLKKPDPTNTLLRFDPSNATVHLYTKMYAQISCNMDFGRFPFDEQVCFLRHSSVNMDINSEVANLSRSRL